MKRVRNCQSSHPDFQMCARTDGVGCPPDSCDIEDGIYPNPKVELLAFEEEVVTVAAGMPDRAAFVRVLGKGVALLGLTEVEIAREFGASRPAVRKWLSGESAPHTAMWQPVFEWLRRLTMRRLGR